jgi:hypothetical protein
MAEPAMQQDHRRAGSVHGVPDSGDIVFDITLLISDWQRRGTLRFKPAEVIILHFHFDLPGS